MPFICTHYFLVEAASGFRDGILTTVAVSVVSFILILIFVIIIVAQRCIIMKRKAPTIMASESSAKAAEADVCSNEAYGMTKTAEEGIYEML